MATTLIELKTELEAARDALQAQAAPLHAKAEALRAQIAPLDAELRAVEKQIKDIERPKLRDLLTDLAKITRALKPPATKKLPAEPPPAEPPA